MKIVIILIVVMIGAVLGGVWVEKLRGQKDGTKEAQKNAENLIEEDGKQTIVIKAKGGYFPRTTQAKANLATQIKLETEGTFDCSAAIVIPELGYRANLPPSGATTVDVPAQEKGAKIKGLCTMGMYSFVINFN